MYNTPCSLTPYMLPLFLPSSSGYDQLRLPSYPLLSRFAPLHLKNIYCICYMYNTPCSLAPYMLPLFLPSSSGYGYTLLSLHLHHPPLPPPPTSVSSPQPSQHSSHKLSISFLCSFFFHLAYHLSSIYPFPLLRHVLFAIAPQFFFRRLFSQPVCKFLCVPCLSSHQHALAVVFYQLDKTAVTAVICREFLKRAAQNRIGGCCRGGFL